MRLKLKHTVLFLLLTGTTAFAQISLNEKITINANSNAFLDVSQNTIGKPNNIGRGLLFPQTDLSTFTLDISAADGINYPTYFDGMIVYNTHEGDATTDPSLTTQTENLEKGFYYFSNPTGKDTQSIANGKWVRISDSFAGKGEWKYNPDNKRIDLVRGGQGNFINKISYTPKGFRFINKNITSTKGYDYINSTVRNTSLDDIKTPYFLAMKSSDMEVSTAKDSYSSSYGFEAVRNYINIDVVNSPNPSNTNLLPYSFYANLDEKNTQDYRVVTGFTSSIEKMNNANISESITSVKARNILGGAGNITNVLACDAVSLLDKTSGSVDNLIGMNSYLTIRQGNQANVNNAYSVKGRAYFRGPSDINNLYIYYSEGNYRYYTGTITNYYDYYAENITETSNITNIYGVYIKGDYKTNYLEGKLGIGTTTPSEKLEVAGAVKAESFKGSNGATLFPDYVFENYYTGTSTAKADYSFKNLDQVEDFVKTNGHLPGYQSAKEVKAQGYIDLMDTQLTNVEKIEELYLHTIEQEKKIEQQSKEIEELKSLVKQLLNK